MTPEEFLTADEETRIIEAIRKAEKNTSGEIRVHLESKNKEKPSMAYVWEVFNKIGMTETKQKNGVLFYVDVHHHTFIIIGDEGINQVVPDNFWDQIKQTVIRHFKQEEYAQGLVEGILMVGQQLKTYFPYKEDDVNELPDEISKH